jgi:hypothetical protein
MLTLLASSLLLVGRVLGQTVTCAGKGHTQSGNNNYVVDYFNDALLFTYAVNQCTVISLLDASTYVKYTCVQNGNDWTVNKATYGDKTCTGTPDASEDWTTVGTIGEQGYYKCDGDNNFARIQITTDTECLGALDLYGGLGGCALNSMAYDTKFFCNSTNALVQLYTPTDDDSIGMCNDDLSFCTKWNFRSSGCALSAIFSGTAVYGKMITCTTNSGTTTTASAGTTTAAGTTTSTEAMTTSSAKSFSVLSASVALVIGLFY